MRWARALWKAAAALPLAGRNGLDRLDIDEFAWRSKRTLEALCRARAQPVYLGGDEALCRILGRYKLFVDTRDRGLCAHLLLDGCWEMGLTMHVARHVRAGMVAVDVGANFGYYTTLLGALVGEFGHVYAIEPAPATAAMLRRSLALNGFFLNATVIEAAAGAACEETVLLHVPDREPKNAQIVVSREAVAALAGSLHEVRQVQIDALAAQWGRIDFVKIDAEGAEEAIIAGMQAVLRRDRPHLVLEFNARRAHDPDRLLANLCDIYGRRSPRYIDLNGNLRDATIAQLLTEQFGIDWLVVFAI
jgi:FkbM family methyltransferase